MSGMAGGPPPGDVAAPAGEPERASRRPGLGLVVGVAIGVIAVSGALLAVVSGSGGDDPPERRPPPDATAEAGRFEHQYPAAYDGPVWVTVDAPDAAPRTVTIRWGDYQRVVMHEGSAPHAYVFDKSANEPGEEKPTFVIVEPAAEVAFASGPTPPSDADDVNRDWSPIPEAAS